MERRQFLKAAAAAVLVPVAVPVAESHISGGPPGGPYSSSVSSCSCDVPLTPTSWEVTIPQEDRKSIRPRLTPEQRQAVIDAIRRIYTGPGIPIVIV